MHAKFISEPNGPELHNSVRGTLHRVDPAIITDGWEGESLAAIRTAHGLTRFGAEPPRVIDTADFIKRIPAAVWQKVTDFALTNADLNKALFQLSASPQVHSNNADLLAVLGGLVQAQVLTSAERDQILAF
jgi:hypothetical protein